MEEEKQSMDLSEEQIKEMDTLFKKLDVSDAKSLLKEFLTKDVYNKMKNRVTKLGLGLDVCIRSGIDNIDSGMGVYASDQESYNLFNELFYPIIKKYHKIDGDMNKFKHPKQNFNFDDSFDGNLDPTGKFVISTRVRVARNIDGYPLRPGMNKEQTMELESKIKNILLTLTGELKGKYYALNNMDEKTRQQLVDDHFLFKKGDRFLESAGINKYWPNGRGIYYNENKTFLVWINEEDQLRIISMEQGGNIKGVFNRLKNGVNAIGNKLNFAYDEKFGYLSSCPSNLGCGERASVHIKIPLVSSNKELLNKICNQFNLQPRGVNGEHSESKGGVYDISNKRRLGITEWEGVKDLIQGTQALIKAEIELQNKQ